MTAFVVSLSGILHTRCIKVLDFFTQKITHLSIMMTEEIKIFSSEVKYPSMHNRQTDGKCNYRIDAHWLEQSST